MTALSAYNGESEEDMSKEAWLRRARINQRLNDVQQSEASKVLRTMARQEKA